jgi:signal transduction histidine kinase
VAWAGIRARRARADVAQLVVELAQSPPAGGLRDVLASIVGDPGLVLAYPLDGSARLVDVRGGTVELPPQPGQRTTLVQDGRPVGVLAHAPGLLDDEQLVAEVAAAGRLALENERLQAEVRARIEDLRASRARIVAAGDAERRRLERDLHDGAQQRLVALALSLRLLRSRLTSETALELAERELGLAVEELRDLAHGLFPALLADEGLEAAVQALSEESTVPLRVGDLPRERLDPSLETAAYTVVAETVRAATGSVDVRASRAHETLVVELRAPDVDGLDVVALEDRLGALDGRLAILRGAVDTTVRAELPCAS